MFFGRWMDANGACGAMGKGIGHLRGTVGIGDYLNGTNMMYTGEPPMKNPRESTFTEPGNMCFWNSFTDGKPVYDSGFRADLGIEEKVFLSRGKGLSHGKAIQLNIKGKEKGHKGKPRYRDGIVGGRAASCHRWLDPRPPGSDADSDCLCARG